MTDGHRDELKRICIQILNDEPRDLDQLIDAAEKLYEKLLLAQYLEDRKERQASLHERITEAAREVIEKAERQEIEIPEPPISEEAKAGGGDPFAFNSEIKVVPIPEGPPKPKRVEVEEVKAPEPIPEPKPIPEDAVVGYKDAGGSKKASINERFNQTRLNIGLNDRIAFVKHLFGGSQEDFNRVISQINTLDSYPEAESFIHDLVKADYDWEGKEEYEERFVGLIKARFGVTE